MDSNPVKYYLFKTCLLNMPHPQPQLQSSHKKRRTLGWLVPVLALTSLLRKVKAARATRRLEGKTSSNKSSWRTSFMIKNKNKKSKAEEEFNYIDEDELYYYSSDEEEEVGGIWQRSILMGDKCNPLEFSGAIYYDEKGNKLEEMPQRTPRARLLLPCDHKEEEDFGYGGVWQRSILMGGKCQPLDFSGVIRYDEKGRKLDGLPPSRSPLASPLHSFLHVPALG